MIRLLASLVTAGVLSMPFCHTVHAKTNCEDVGPYGPPPVAVYAARQDIINGQQFYRCWGATANDNSICWLVRHSDHETFVAGGDLYCP